MRVSSIILLIAILAGGYWYAQKEGWIGKTEQAVEESFEYHLANGKKLYNSMKYDEAIAELEKAIQLEPNNTDMPRALRCLGDCYKEKKDYKKAIEIYEQSIREYPNDKMRGDTEKAMELVKSIGHF